MASPQAEALWRAFRDAPMKQIDMALPQRREAGLHAEDPTSEPAGVTYTEAPEVGGLWATPAREREHAKVLYLFGGGYVPGTPQTRRKTAGHIANSSSARVLVPKGRRAA